MIAKKPLSADERILKYAVFAAEFDVHENLYIYGRRLNFQYYSVDVVLTIFTFSALSAVALTVGICKFCLGVSACLEKRRCQKVK